MDFYKYSVYSGDFIVIDNWDAQINENELSKLAKTLLKPKHAIGGDGLIFINSGPNEADFAIRHFNALGQETGININALVASARAAYDLGIAPEEMSFKAKSSLIEAKVQENEVVLSLDNLPEPEGAALIDAEGFNLTYNRLTIGDLQAVCFVDNLDDLNVVKISRAIKDHPAFAPDGADINFGRVVNKKLLAVRSYTKRSSSESSGSLAGVLATALLAFKQDFLENSVTALMKSGENLVLNLEANGDTIKKVTLDAQVKYIFSGKTEKDIFELS